MTRTHLPLILLISPILAACGPRTAIAPTHAPAWTSTLTATVLPTETEPATPTPLPSPSLYPLPALEATLGPCDERRPADLFAEVTASFGISPDYVPPDLVRLGGYVSGYVALPDLMLRQEAARALGSMVKAMKAAGLAPTVLSAYRSYTDQYLSYQRWLAADPENASQVSQQPGHSEHQLGTVVDFGSPELAALTGDPAEKFSPLFAQTSEGGWLAEHAHEYGFTLTNPLGAERLTGLTYEPWHYRYVGPELAAYLHESGYFLTEYLFQVRPGVPCTSD